MYCYGYSSYFVKLQESIINGLCKCHFSSPEKLNFKSVPSRRMGLQNVGIGSF